MMHSIPNTMKAVVLTKPTAAEDILLTDIPVPAVKSGWVLVKIHAFGLNHSEQILRQFEIEHDYIQVFNRASFTAAHRCALRIPRYCQSLCSMRRR